ncbi:cytochrome b5 domain-containing protein [Tessaracoccus sp.]
MSIFDVVTTGLFDNVGGLPTHPLVVHLAVVVLPVSALALIAIIVVPAWRAAYGWLTMAGVAVGAGGAFLAAQTGEVLARQVGSPQDHAKWGDVLEKAALGLFVVAAIWFVLQRRNAAETNGGVRRVLGPPLQAAAALLSIVAAAGVLALTVVVGHSGAAAVWGDQVTAPSPIPAASKKAVPAAPPSTSSGTAASAVVITQADVQQHATAASCWSVVDAQVYDLTTWIPQHPGGAEVIKALCGRDGSAAFHNEHASQKEPGATLAEFRIGALTQ